MPASTTPIPDLYLFQLGTESTWGTPVPQTAKLGLMEELSIQPEMEGMSIKDVRASLAPSYGSALMKQTGSAKGSGIATYQDLPYWLDSLFGQATPGGANPYTRDYIGALGTIPTRRTFTLMKGSPSPYSHSYSLSGALVSELTVKIEAGQPWMYDVNFIGKNVVTDTIDNLSERTLTPIQGQETSLYIDAVGGTIGTTQITTTWFSAELNIKSNAEAYLGLGSTAAAGYREARWEATLKLVLEVQAGPKGYLDSIIGASLLKHQVRIKATTGSTAIQQFDIAGVYLQSPEITTDTDGVSTFEFELSSEYNAALGNFLKAHNTNAVATLP